MRIRRLFAVLLGGAVLAAAPGARDPASRAHAAEPTAAAGAVSGGRLSASTEQSEDTQAQDGPAAVDPAPKRELRAGSVQARLKAPGGAPRFAAESRVFAEITLSAVKPAKRADAELILEAEGAEILHVSGLKRPRKKSRRKQKQETPPETASSQQRAVPVANLRRGKSRKITVELLLKGGGTGLERERDSTNRLKITLRAAGGEDDATDSAVLSWSVADCASGFYAELVSIRDRNAEAMGAALKAARSRSAGRPGSWLFAPPAYRSGRKRVCVRWSRRWSSRYKRYRSVCRRYRTVRRAAPTVAGVTADQRAIYRFASPYIRSRAVDRQLSRQQHHGWVSHRVAADLKGYLQQEKHPAICTGAIEFVDYFSERMQEVRERGGQFSAKLAQVGTLVPGLVADAREAVKADPGGHPGWGIAPLHLQGSGAERSPIDLIADLAALAGDAAPLEEIRQADDVFAALKIMKSFERDGGLKPLSKTTRASVRHALSLIEAGDYIGTVHGHYAAIEQSIVGSLTAVRKAHSEHCTCGG